MRYQKSSAHLVLSPEYVSVCVYISRSPVYVCSILSGGVAWDLGLHFVPISARDFVSFQAPHFFLAVQTKRAKFCRCPAPQSLRCPPYGPSAATIANVRSRRLVVVRLLHAPLWRNGAAVGGGKDQGVLRQGLRCHLSTHVEGVQAWPFVTPRHRMRSVRFPCRFESTYHTCCCGRPRHPLSLTC